MCSVLCPLTRLPIATVIQCSANTLREWSAQPPLSLLLPPSQGKFTTSSGEKNAEIGKFNHHSAYPGLASSPGRFFFPIIEREGEGKKRPGIYCTGGSAHALNIYLIS